MAERAVLEVMKPGLLTTVQDIGRPGYQQYGIVVSGAMDRYALRMANLLVGNEECAAGLEITLTGPSVKFLDDCLIAITGADLSPLLGGNPVPLWTRLEVEKGMILQFGDVMAGCRTYIAVSGGFDVPFLMGSRSTYLRAGIGGHEGRSLIKGDILHRCECPSMKQDFRKRLHGELIPSYPDTIELRIMKGPQWDRFAEKSRKEFLASLFKVSPHSDRMGYRLQGPSMQTVDREEQITDPIPDGAIQIPNNGEPIVLLADRQTTGGYPKIGVIISVDLPKIAQAKPGNRIRFSLVDLEESHRLLKEQEHIFRLLSFANQ